MKASILIASLLLSFSLKANELQNPPPVQDRLGKIMFRLAATTEDDLYEPLRLKMMVHCAKKKSPEVIIADLHLCDYRPYDWNPDTKVLTLHYSTHTPNPGEAQCNTHWTREFHLDIQCRE